MLAPTRKMANDCAGEAFRSRGTVNPSPTPFGADLGDNVNFQFFGIVIVSTISRSVSRRSEMAEIPEF